MISSGNQYVELAHVVLKKFKVTQNLLETLSLTFRLSNVRESETIKYAYDCDLMFCSPFVGYIVS